MVFDKINTSFTYLNKDAELFKVVNVKMQETMEEYVDLAERTEKAQKEYFTAPLGNDVFQLYSSEFRHQFLSAQWQQLFYSLYWLKYQK